MSGLLISGLPLWEQHEERVLSILRSALLRLRTKRPQGNEHKLNREFYFCILDVNRENQESGGPWFDYPPVYEARNPPTPDTEDSASERKIPDLSWGYIDHQEQDPRRSVRTFAIECKRLGSPSSAGWKFNVHYVCDGVRRFTNLEWQYGRNVATGAMVGYVESLTPGEIVAEVNGVLTELGVPALPLPEGTDESLTEMEHTFCRPFAISPFRLVHFWIDIRPTGCQKCPVSSPPDAGGTGGTIQ